MDNDAIFLVRDGALVPLVNTAYDSEGVLQKLLAEFPDLIAGGQVDPDAPRRWVLVGREVGVPDHQGGGDRWSLDHLILDQEAIPTVVEVKRSSDTRVRREVIGQMLDYAANGVQYWPIDALRSRFESNHEHPDEVVAELTDNAYSYDEFWDQVAANLRARRIRMVWVADVIPTELLTIIEYLNEELTQGQALGVEIRQYAGEGIQVLAPRVLGMTATQRVEKRSKSARYSENIERASAETRAIAELFEELGESDEYEASPTQTALKLRFTGNGTAALLYPQWDHVEFNLGQIADAGLQEEAEELQAMFSAAAGKPVTERNPYIPTAAVLANWDEFTTKILPRYAAAHRRARDLRSRGS